MYEHRREPLLTFGRFLLRMTLHLLVIVLLLVISLVLGVWGFTHFGEMRPIDALLNSAMLLTGMGPVGSMKADAGKLFATFYALYSGMFFLILAGVFFAPVLHRFVHHFHLELVEDDAEDAAPPEQAR